MLVGQESVAETLVRSAQSVGGVVKSLGVAERAGKAVCRKIFGLNEKERSRLSFIGKKFESFFGFEPPYWAVDSESHKAMMLNDSNYRAIDSWNDYVVGEFKRESKQITNPQFDVAEHIALLAAQYLDNRRARFEAKGNKGDSITLLFYGLIRFAKEHVLTWSDTTSATQGMRRLAGFLNACSCNASKIVCHGDRSVMGVTQEQSSLAALDLIKTYVEKIADNTIEQSMNVIFQEAIKKVFDLSRTTIQDMLRWVLHFRVPVNKKKPATFTLDDLITNNPNNENQLAMRNSETGKLLRYFLNRAFLDQNIQVYLSNEMSIFPGAIDISDLTNWYLGPEDNLLLPTEKSQHALKKCPDNDSLGMPYLSNPVDLTGGGAGKV